MEALTIWKKQRRSIDLLVTDMVMPGGVNGQQLARRLNQSQPDLKIIFTSGYSPEIAGRQLQLRDSENFLQKPFRPDQLLQLIRRSLDEGRR